MTKFEDGDRVEAIEDSMYTAYEKGDTGVISGNQLNKDDGGTIYFPDPDNFKLITEEPMTVITALEKSITHWQEIVAVFGGAKAGEVRERPAMGTDSCALCQYFCVNSNGGCQACPVNACHSDSLYGRVEGAETNADAYTASKAMLARLEELLEEEKGKGKAAIRVGDIVVNREVAESHDIGTFSGVVHKINSCYVYYTNIKGKLRHDPIEHFTLIHRPTKGK